MEQDVHNPLTITPDSIRELLRADGFLIVNKTLMRIFGINNTLYLCELLSRDAYYREQGLSKDGWFYCTQSDIENNLMLTPYQQRRCAEDLNNMRILMTKKEGIPARIYYKIAYSGIASKINKQDVKKLNNKMSRNCTSVCLETAHHTLLEEDKKKNKKDFPPYPPKTNSGKKGKAPTMEDSMKALPEHLRDDAPFVVMWKAWWEYRGTVGGPYKTMHGVNGAINKLAPHDAGTAAKMLEQSMDNEWQGLFPLKAQRGNGGTGPRQAPVDDQGYATGPPPDDINIGVKPDYIK